MFDAWKPLDLCQYRNRYSHFCKYRSHFFIAEIECMLRLRGFYFILVSAFSFFPFSIPAFSDPSSQGGVGDLLITPTRVMLEGKKRTAEVTLNNRGPKEAVYRISLEHKRMRENGEYEEAKETKPGERFADEMVRYSPRQVTLKPGASQTVRFMMRVPEGAEQGEYRSHVLFRAVPQQPQGEDVEQGAVDAKQISIRLIPVYGVSIPLIVRVGELAANGSLSDAKLDGKTLSLAIHRQGTRSLYGDIVVTNDGGTVVGQMKGVAVFTPNTTRTLKLELSPPSGAPLSNLTVVYREREENGGATIAETKVKG